MKRIKKGNIEPAKVEPINEPEIIVEHNEIDIPEKLPDVEPLKESEKELLKEIEAEISDNYTTEIETPVKRKRNKKTEVSAPVAEPVKTEPPKIIIPGRLVVKVTDKVFTRLLTTIDSFTSKDDPIDPGLLSLDDDEIQDLIPMAEQMIASLKLSEHPVAYYFASLGAIYTTNFMMVKSIMRKQKKQNTKK